MQTELCKTLPCTLRRFVLMIALLVTMVVIVATVFGWAVVGVLALYGS